MLVAVIDNLVWKWEGQHPLKNLGFDACSEIGGDD